MSILDQLLEKKDLMIYIDMRINHLKQVRKEAKKLKSNLRNIRCSKHTNKIKELEKLKSIISRGLLKDRCKDYWVKE